MGDGFTRFSMGFDEIVVSGLVPFISLEQAVFHVALAVTLCLLASAGVVEESFCKKRVILLRGMLANICSVVKPWGGRCDLHPSTQSATSFVMSPGTTGIAVGPSFASFALWGHLFLAERRGEWTWGATVAVTAGSEPICHFSHLFFLQIQNSYLWRPCMIQMVWVSILGSQSDKNLSKSGQYVVF